MVQWRGATVLEQQVHIPFRTTLRYVGCANLELVLVVAGFRFDQPNFSNQLTARASSRRFLSSATFPPTVHEPI
jgi:hypothetical protein